MFPTFISVEAPLSTSIATDATIEITIIYCYMTSLLRIKIDTTATTRAFPILSDLNRYIHVTATSDLAMVINLSIPTRSCHQILQPLYRPTLLTLNSSNPIHSFYHFRPEYVSFQQISPSLSFSQSIYFAVVVTATK